MQEWKLPSQLVNTNRNKDEKVEDFFLRHEITRRVMAEHNLIETLDYLYTLSKGNTNTKPEEYLNKFLDKTLYN